MPRLPRRVPKVNHRLWACAQTLSWLILNVFGKLVQRLCNSRPPLRFKEEAVARLPHLIATLNDEKFGAASSHTMKV